MTRTGADLISIAGKTWNPYYLGYAIDSGAADPQQAFRRDGGNHLFCGWNTEIWLEQARIMKASLPRSSDAAGGIQEWTPTEIRGLTTITPSRQDAFALHCDVIAKRLGDKLDQYIKGKIGERLRN